MADIDYRLIFMLSVLAVVNIVTVDSIPRCPPGGTYRDKHTGRSECCSGICRDAKFRRTEESCSKFCPGYHTAEQPGLSVDRGRVDEVVENHAPKAPPAIDSGSNSALIVVLAVIALAVTTGIPVAIAIKRGGCRPPWQRAEVGRNINPPNHLGGQQLDEPARQNLMDAAHQHQDDEGDVGEANQPERDQGQQGDLGRDDRNDQQQQQQCLQRPQQVVIQAREAEPLRSPVPESGEASRALGDGV